MSGDPGEPEPEPEPGQALGKSEVDLQGTKKTPAMSATWLRAQVCESAGKTRMQSGPAPGKSLKKALVARLCW